MGNLCSVSSGAVGPKQPAKSASFGARSQSGTSASARSSGSKTPGFARISSSIGRAVARRGAAARAAADAANSRLQLEERLAEAIKAKAAAGAASPRPTVSFNRLLLRFGTLHDGFAACRAVFKRLTGGAPGGEVSLEQLQGSCRELGYHLDEATLSRIFASADLDGSRSLNADEFVVVLAILHILKGPEDEERVDPAILATWTTCEQAFLCFASSKDGWIEKGELLNMMHEGATDGVRHSSSGSGADPIRSIAQRRFEELDRDGRGRVSFLEFLFCLEGWVEDAEEEDEEGAAAA